MRPLLQIETRSGSPYQAGGIRIIPFAQVARLDLPGIHGGMIWNRPSSVLAVYPDGSEQVIPVIDRTRRIQLALLGTGLVSGLLIWLIDRIRQSNRREFDE